MAHEALPHPQISQPAWLSIHYTFTICVLSQLNHVRLCATLLTVAHQAHLSMRCSRQGYWSGLPCPPPGDLLEPRIQPTSPALQADSLPLSHRGGPHLHYLCLKVFFFPSLSNKNIPLGSYQKHQHKVVVRSIDAGAKFSGFKSQLESESHSVMSDSSRPWS